ncbi:uncharacterized protein LOC132062053 [Lycium ferocissimum]|uniref:uncharacterized protein LOC132062053 n=1 Tax=Lycium ferocissimum TaxID=112874 RepID=UPI0028150392|nr:uncharacterized protein LOC132062053 [Lycium ferocissimum]
MLNVSPLSQQNVSPLSPPLSPPPPLPRQHHCHPPPPPKSVHFAPKTTTLESKHSNHDKNNDKKHDKSHGKSKKKANWGKKLGFMFVGVAGSRSIGVPRCESKYNMTGTYMNQEGGEIVSSSHHDAISE